MNFSVIKELILEAEACGRIGELDSVAGLSGTTLIGALQRLAHYQRSIGCYLEVGVFQGNTLLSVAKASPDIHAYGIDNFSQFDRDGKNQSIISYRIERNEIHNATLLNIDYEDALENLEQLIPNEKVGLYFVDGPHDYRSQLVCLLLAKPHLAPRSIIVVDDCNYRHVRLANRDFLVTNPEFKLIFESYTHTHPQNARPEQLEKAKSGWWNGVNIIVHDPDHTLDPMYPPTLRDRTLYENEHVVHAARRGYLAPEAVGFFSDLLDFKPIRAAATFVHAIRKTRLVQKELIGEFRSANTFSDGLASPRFNPKLAP